MCTINLWNIKRDGTNFCHTTPKINPNQTIFKSDLKLFIFENNFSKRQEINRWVETAFELSPAPLTDDYWKFFVWKLFAVVGLLVKIGIDEKNIHWNNFTAYFTRLGIFHHFHTPHKAMMMMKKIINAEYQ